MSNKSVDDQLDQAETERRFNAALKRALNTPHKPQKPLKKVGKKKPIKPKGL